jgi:DNA-directed RNA polymerase subunit K/omega
MANIGQIMGSVGQQFYRGQRLKPTLTNNTRLLPAFDPNDNDPKANAFIANSFYTGVDAPELHFLQAGGREGLLDTALKTSETGRMQRLMMKAFEGVVVAYDGSIRNTIGTMFSPMYNAGYDIAELIEVPDKRRPQLSSFIDLASTISEINIKRGWVPKETNTKIAQMRKDVLQSQLPDPVFYIKDIPVDKNLLFDNSAYGPIVKDTNQSVDLSEVIEPSFPPVKITKYEKARLIGARAMQLSNNDNPLVDIGDEIDPIKISTMEYDAGLLPIYVIRKYPDGTTQIVYPSRLSELNYQLNNVLKEIQIMQDSENAGEIIDEHLLQDLTLQRETLTLEKRNLLSRYQ